MYCEFFCPECKTNFELLSEKDFQLDYVICIECGCPKIKLLRSDEEVTSRLEKVICAVKELSDRIEVVEDCINADIGPNSLGRKKEPLN